MVGVLIVDDHWMVREGLGETLAKVPDVSVVGEVSTVKELFAFLADPQAKLGKDPDVILLDAVLGADSGIDCIPNLKKMTKARVLVLSMLSENPHAVRAIEQGADGFISKGGSPRELVDAIRVVASGHRYISSIVGQLLADRLSRTHDLTPRESEIVRYYALGFRCGEIARVMSLSPKTVSTHKTNAMRKLGITNNADLIRWAIDSALV